MESHHCEMCGDDDEEVSFIAGVGLICRTCERLEFGPFDDEEPSDV